MSVNKEIVEIYLSIDRDIHDNYFNDFFEYVNLNSSEFLRERDIYIFDDEDDFYDNLPLISIDKKRMTLSINDFEFAETYYFSFLISKDYLNQSSFIYLFILENVGDGEFNDISVIEFYTKERMPILQLGLGKKIVDRHSKDIENLESGFYAINEKGQTEKIGCYILKT